MAGMKKKAKKLTLSAAKKRARSAHSLWIRTNGSSAGTNVCITCGIRKPIKGRGVIQAGHFVVGRRNSTFFHPKNCHPQCYGCNVGKKGNMVYYYEFMLKTYGKETIDELKRLNRTIVKYSIQDYLDIEQKYKDKLQKLLTS